MMVASSVVLPTPLRPMIDTRFAGAEREANVLEHHGLAVAGADVVEFERAFSHDGLRGGLPGRDRPPAPARCS